MTADAGMHHVARDASSRSSPKCFRGRSALSLAGKALGEGPVGARRDRHPRSRDRQASHRRRHAGGRRSRHGDEGRRAGARDRCGAGDGRPRLLMTPRGAPLTQRARRALAAGPGAVDRVRPVRGRGRARDRGARRSKRSRSAISCCRAARSPRMALIDACVRLLPGVMGKEASGAEESFADGLLEYPHYTRPQLFEGPADPRGADLRRPRQDRRLAARRGRTADPRAPAGPLGGAHRTAQTAIKSQ